MATHIYIDESGSLADPHCLIVTLAAIHTASPNTLRWIIKRVKRGVQRKKSKHRRPAELKFHNATDQARAEVLEALAQEQVAIYALSIFKGARTIPHTPENYGILLCKLLRASGAEEKELVELSMDMPFNVLRRRTQLTEIVRQNLNLDVAPQYVDSIKNPCVQLADFVAGAVHAKHSGRGAVFYHFIRPRMISDRMMTWSALRREWIEASSEWK